MVHLVVDWLFQNEWIAEHKTRLSHPAGWLHAAGHGAALLLVFPPVAAVLLAASHFLVDSRSPLTWWSRIMSQPDTGPAAMPVHIWRDQTLHIALIAIAALIVG